MHELHELHPAPSSLAAPQVSSTETGVIFGNVVYEGTGYAERSVVVLNDIHIDIMDYISPASCPDVAFRCGNACTLLPWPGGDCQCISFDAMAR
jgi:coatomer subunit beta